MDPVVVEQCARELVLLAEALVDTGCPDPIAVRILEARAGRLGIS